MVVVVAEEVVVVVVVLVVVLVVVVVAVENEIKKMLTNPSDCKFSSLAIHVAFIAFILHNNLSLAYYHK